MRLIDADALEKWIEDEIKAIEDKDPVMAMGGIGCLNMVKRSPTIVLSQEEEVVHGKWIFDEDHVKEIYVHPVICSECGQDMILEWGEDTPYCPNCGAKMDKGGEES